MLGARTVPERNAAQDLKGVAQIFNILQFAYMV